MSGPLRLCMVTTFYPPFNFGGDGITVQRLANALAERGHEVEVVHCVDAFDMLRPEGVRSGRADTRTTHPSSITRCAIVPGGCLPCSHSKPDRRS